MSKLIDQPIQMHVDPAGRPDVFVWQRRYGTGVYDPPATEKVEEITERWSESGQWWDGELEKVFYVVTTSAHKVFELYQDNGGRWFVYKVLD